MSNWALQGDIQRYQTFGFDAGTTQTGVVLTADASANTKGAYTELVSSTSIVADRATFIFSQHSVYEDCLIDIAIGAASSEQIIISNIYTAVKTDEIQTPFSIPLHIPSGTRISARMQSATGSATIRVMGMISSSGFVPSKPFQRCTTYGANTADSGGTLVDSGGTANTKGSYVEITSSSTNRIRNLVLGIGSHGDFVRVDQRFLVDIAVGGSGSEVVVIPDFPLMSSNGNDLPGPNNYIFNIDIPAGTRIAVRCQADQSPSSEDIDVILYGLD